MDKRFEDNRLEAWNLLGLVVLIMLGVALLVILFEATYHKGWMIGFNQCKQAIGID